MEWDSHDWSGGPALLDSFQQGWQDLIQNVRVEDLIDIGIVACIIYVLAYWLLRRPSRGALAAVVILSFLYIASIAYDLYLTTMIFRTGFVVLVFSVVIILQDDIRRAFEQIASIRFSQPDPVFNHDTINVLVETISFFAEKRIGALLVFEGNEPIERHTHGGIEVDGLISLPLLASIFDPHSAGHDGAVVVDGDRVLKIGLHLPLSKNIEALGRSGTRHAAALGLSECSDATIVVVSEERGRFSIAHNGQLQVTDVGELKRQLNEVYATRGQSKSREEWWQFLIRRPLLKLTSLVAATVLWFFLGFQVATIQRNLVVPIQFKNVPNGFVVEDTSFDYAAMTLSGSERAFQLLNKESVVVSFDLKNSQTANYVEFQTRRGVEGLPAGIAVAQVLPETFSIKLKKTTVEKPKN